MSCMVKVEAAELGLVDLVRALETVLRDGAVSDAAFRVWCAVALRVNRKSGRCDPSLARIAADTGRDVRSVLRAVKSAVQAGYLQRSRHGGRRHTNAYALNWARLREAGAARPLVADVASVPESSPPLEREACPVSAPAMPLRGPEKPRERPSVKVPVGGCPAKALPAGRGSAAVADSAAQRRLYSDLQGRGCLPGYLGAATAEIEAQAVRAERSKPGSGLWAALDALGMAVRESAGNSDKSVAFNATNLSPKPRF